MSVDVVPLCADSLLAYPLYVALHRWRRAQRLECVEFPRQGHFVEQAVDGLVAGAAQRDTGLQLFLRHVLAEMCPTMNLARNEVVKRQVGMPSAEATGTSLVFAAVHQLAYL